MAQKEITYENAHFAINYEIVNNSEENIIIFLHGWGSNKEVMKTAFSSTLRTFKHIYIDMPGFGKSNNDMVLTTQDYANIMQLFLSKFQLDAKNLCIVGHSFGGKVATLLNPKYLILLSSAGIIEEKSSDVKFKIKLSKFLKTIGLGGLTKAFRSKDVNTMSQNMYETFKNVVDEDFSLIFQSFKNRALIFWGEQDRATSLESGRKIASLIKDSVFTSYNDDHYFFLRNASDISKKIEDGIL